MNTELIIAAYPDVKRRLIVYEKEIRRITGFTVQLVPFYDGRTSVDLRNQVEAKYKEVICEEIGTTWKKVMSRKRTPNESDARHIFGYIMKVEHSYTYTSIGVMLGLDHASVIHGKKRIEKLIIENKYLGLITKDIIKKVAGNTGI